MAWPIALGAIGGALLGGMFQKDANEENRASQEAFAQHGIRWKVADAKAAGLHPLFALGGAGAAFTPSAQPLMTAAEGASMGQNIGRAIAGDDLAKAQLTLAQAQTKKTEMETLALASDIKLQEQRAQASSQVAQSFPVVMPGAPQGNNLGEINPDGSWMLGQPRPLGPLPAAPPAYLSSNEPKAALRPWAVAGVPGGQVLLPDASSFAEAMESLENPVNQAFILYQNSAHYGRGVSAWLKDQLFNKLPSEKWFSGAGRAIHRWSIR